MTIETDRLAVGVQGAFSAVAIAFMKKAVVAMVPWLMVMFAVICCDLVVGLRRCRLMGERIRLSKAVRHTMGKAVTYTSFVLMVTMIELAEGGNMHIDRWACLLVCAVEFCSILSNILRPKGYELDFGKTFGLLCRKMFGFNVEELKKDDNGKDKEDSEGRA